MSPIQEEIILSKTFYETLLSYGITEEEIQYFASEIVSFITLDTKEEDVISVRKYIDIERKFRKFYGDDLPSIH